MTHDVAPARVIPQANRLDKLAVVIDAVFAGANTDASIADALGMSGRQGSYYATAARSLGLTIDDGGSPREWALTSSGELLRASSPVVRAGLLCTLVSAHGDALASVEDTAEEQFAHSGLSRSTAQRRAATVQAWVDQATDPEFVAVLAREIDATKITAAAASTRLQEQRAAKAAEAARQAALEKRPACGTCWMELPVSGVCPDC